MHRLLVRLAEGAGRHRAGRGLRAGLALGTLLAGLAAARPMGSSRGSEVAPDAPVRPGITVLIRDSIALVRDRRVGLITNQTGIDGHREADIDLLMRSDQARAAGVRLVALFSPEHGIRGTEDHPNIAGETDARTGLSVISLYGATTLPPPDSTLDRLDVLVFDLQDIGTRTWTFVGTMVYAMRAAARHHLPFIVLDRPNPITGTHVEGPLLDTVLSNADDDTPTRRAQAYALYPVPLRHGMTMGEMARFLNAALALGADLHVMPAAGWRRSQWFDETGLPWVRPSPNLPDLTSALLYPGLVAFEGSNLSVGRGTPAAFQEVGAPWLRSDTVAAMLNDHGFAGVRFEAVRFTPDHPGDGKFGGQEISGVRIVVTDRNAVQSARVGAGLLWAVGLTSPDSLRIRDLTFDRRMGAARVREALLRGEDPDAVLDREEPGVVAFREQVKRYLMYR